MSKPCQVQRCVRQSYVSRCKFRIFSNGFCEVLPRYLKRLRPGELRHKVVASPEESFIRRWIDRAGHAKPSLLLGTELHPNLLRHRLGDLPLHGKDVAHRALIVLAPEI